MTALLWVLLAGNVFVTAGLVIWAVRWHRDMVLLKASVTGLAELGPAQLPCEPHEAGNDRPGAQR